MRIFVGMEESQRICIAFRMKGHEAFSCDFKKCSGGHPEWHIQDDVLNHLNDGWDIMILHPNCTKVCVSGNLTYSDTEERLESAKWIESLWFSCIKICDHVCLEQPVGVLNTLTRLPKPQFIQPYQFGHLETKKTSLFLYGLPRLKTTNYVKREMDLLPDKLKHRIYYATGMKDRKMERSKTYYGIAEAMANQWSNFKYTKPFFKL
jgi:hypothetical protein